MDGLPSLLSHFQATERHCLKNQNECHLRNDTRDAHTDVGVCAQVYTHTHTHKLEYFTVQRPLTVKAMTPHCGIGSVEAMKNQSPDIPNLAQAGRFVYLLIQSEELKLCL